MSVVPAIAHTLCFLDGSAYVNHVALVRQARGAEMPARFWTDPLMYQGHGVFLGPNDAVALDPAHGVDFEGEIAVVTGAVPAGADSATARAAITHVTLLNDWSLRGLIPDELSKGFGFVQSKPPSSIAPRALPVADCPGWDGARLHATLHVTLNGAPFGRLATGPEMTFDFPTLIAHAARTRPLPEGTVIGSGTVSNREGAGPGRTIAAGGAGYACIAEQRMVETIRDGAPATPFLAPGDTVAMWVEDAEGRDLFGAMEQTVRTP
ncbi:MAG: fumarylacetoacetate hydrolase family protein [Shimia sp.]